tara:strand:- start:404 stop:718 length:315 start_codon:yes stop_codon:yes gene_type:complete
MTIFSELHKQGGQVKGVSAGDFENDQDSIQLVDTSNFPSNGEVVFKDTLGKVQTLTYTSNNTSTNTLSGVLNFWEGNGFLEAGFPVYEKAYYLLGANYTEVNIT